MAGSTDFAPSPSEEWSVFSGLQPRKSWPSSATIRSKRDLPNSCCWGSFEAKNAPTPYFSGSGRRIPRASQRRFRNS